MCSSGVTRNIEKYLAHQQRSQQYHFLVVIQFAEELLAEIIAKLIDEDIRKFCRNVFHNHFDKMEVILFIELLLKFSRSLLSHSLGSNVSLLESCLP